MDILNDELEAWIASVQHRLARGDLARLGPMPVGEGFPSLPGELYVRIMIADYEHYGDLSPERRRQPDVVAQRMALLSDLHRLRELIG